MCCSERNTTWLSSCFRQVFREDICPGAWVTKRRNPGGRHGGKNISADGLTAARSWGRNGLSVLMKKTGGQCGCSRDTRTAEGAGRERETPGHAGSRREKEVALILYLTQRKATRGKDTVDLSSKCSASVSVCRVVVKLFYWLWLIKGTIPSRSGEMTEFSQDTRRQVYYLSSGVIKLFYSLTHPREVSRKVSFQNELTGGNQL